MQENRGKTQARRHLPPAEVAVGWPRGVGGVCGAINRQLQFAACKITVPKTHAPHNQKMQKLRIVFV